MPNTRSRPSGNQSPTHSRYDVRPNDSSHPNLIASYHRRRSIVVRPLELGAIDGMANGSYRSNRKPYLVGTTFRAGLAGASCPRDPHPAGAGAHPRAAADQAATVASHTANDSPAKAFKKHRRFDVNDLASDTKADGINGYASAGPVPPVRDRAIDSSA